MEIINKKNAEVYKKYKITKDEIQAKLKYLII